MARASIMEERVVVRERFYWPDSQLNIWTIIVLAAGCTILGIFASFMSDQQAMTLPVPWLFPYGVTVGALTIVFILIQLILIAQRRLLPGMMILFSFVLFVLYLTGVIETAIQLFGPGNVSNNCQRYVNNNKIHGVSVSTLAWLEQNDICNEWYAAFSFWLIGDVFFIWMLIMASQVNRGDFD